MTTSQKESEFGWFYHAPMKRQTSPDLTPLPVTSQIPGLNPIDPEEYNTKPREMVFKDTDTKYIRLAKEGGRKDLLVFREPKEKSSEPKGYPRVDWFYLEDNRREDEANKGEDELNWQFLLPEYMVHESYKPNEDEPLEPPSGSHKKVPFAQDNLSVFKRETASANDKTVKIDNARPPGYGVRNSKPPRRNQQTSKCQADANNNSPAGRKDVSDKHQPAMNKLLSYAYEKEWHESQKQNKEKDKTDNNLSNRKDKAVMNRSSAQKQKQKHDEEKELFKLSKFKNIPPRINTHKQTKESKEPANVQK